MDVYWKATAVVVVAAVLGLTVGKQQKELTVLLAAAACTMALAAALTYFVHVLDFFWELQSLIGLQDNVLQQLLKALGIGLTSEIAGMICKDSGNSSLENTVYIVARAMILYLSLPILRAILQLIKQILEIL